MIKFETDMRRAIEASVLPVEAKAEKLWELEEIKKEFSSKESLLGWLKGKAAGRVSVCNGNGVFSGHDKP
ncbi:MAG: hypothetical protein A3G33_08110 [Omnitrophica bacterium RIFCSPLOWO2_12_FULL_44_17]|uniref:Uncharacterized protein n=1 Tax=Candidatus Danuiimicrobium aquiferis TaxID=1801832 RepID=A0A1G1KXW7_9BACT|nr:MAG: hypothetical protein A3B72_05810 [Omnitrophica bacterium RIFCSPHIGHO2_02_FULL_45_28]OGW92337.1 MAG: hypothetical protein A3E74_09385 [Omnitrophica bacterium RIFCSPHIGHO2_12_FULL_44_12]OGW97766.1 MAG: hypothetical protein A3G33_08110 [Omnitrophica bacterium RIFCSPLOWO2_12_FULL_44_17]OGX04982.1 MAG: hypothetical protein A3J12_02100 [Omnitrophica bacterium RIFCSPLOWO2_02_FULL_44_11]